MARDRVESEDPMDADFREDGEEGPSATDPDRERGKPIPDLFRRAMALGLSGFFTTEEAFRRALGDTVPQDWVDFVNEQSERTRAELIERMSTELGRVIQQVDPSELLSSLLEGQTIEIDARIRFVSSEEGERDSAKGVRLRVANDEDA